MTRPKEVFQTLHAEIRKDFPGLRLLFQEETRWYRLVRLLRRPFARWWPMRIIAIWGPRMLLPQHFSPGSAEEIELDTAWRALAAALVQHADQRDEPWWLWRYFTQRGFRLNAEARSYAMILAVQFWMGEPVGQAQIEWMARRLSSGRHGWAGSYQAALDLMRELLNAIHTRGIMQGRPGAPFRTVAEVLSKLRLAHLDAPVLRFRIGPIL